MEAAATPPKIRYLSIDVFRGLTIAVMVFVNTTGDFTSIPWWAHHAKDYGLTYVDLVAPFFIFAIALTYHLNFVSGQAKDGVLNNTLKVLRRYFALVGIGFLGWCVIEMVYQGTIHPVYEWGVFQAIGMAGLVTLPFIMLPRWARFLAGAAIWVVYQWLILHYRIDNINFAEEHSGFWGGLGYGIMMLLATVVCEAFETHKMRDFLIGGAVFTITGAVAAYYWGISKNRLTGPYILVSLGLACFFFYLIWYLYDNRKVTLGSKVLAPIGKNPFFLYIFHGPLTALPTLFLTEQSPWPYVVACGIAAMVIVGAVGLWLDRRKIYISI